MKPLTIDYSREQAPSSLLKMKIIRGLPSTIWKVEMILGYR
jgi:hypothetical protein